LLKRNFSKSELAGIIAFLICIGLLADIFISGGINIIGLAFSTGLILLGRHYKQKDRKKGNIFLIIGIFFFVMCMLGSYAFQFILVAAVAYVGYELYTSKEKPKKMELFIEPSSDQKLEKVEPFVSNMLVGHIRMIDNVYELQDINIHYGIGDIHIDLSLTVLPEGETVILLRGIIGDIRIYVPYDSDVSIQNAVLIGKLNVLGHQEQGFNHSYTLRTENYHQATRKIKIVSSLLIGDIEVRNI
jgi:lia operon protein LiaF